MRKENNGHCREKNKKLHKVKWAGKSDSTPFTGLNIIIFHDGLIFHADIIINRKNWRITITSF